MISNRSNLGALETATKRSPDQLDANKIARLGRDGRKAVRGCPQACPGIGTPQHPYLKEIGTFRVKVAPMQSFEVRSTRHRLKATRRFAKRTGVAVWSCSGMKKGPDPAEKKAVVLIWIDTAGFLVGVIWLSH